MPITDSTTSLATTWTEFDVVSFTAGVLSDIDACVAEVENKLKRGTSSSTTRVTTTDIQNYLSRSKQELVEVKRFTFARRYAYADTVASTYRYSLPPDYNGGRISLRDTTNNFYLAKWDEYPFDLKYPDPSAEDNDKPRVFCIKDRELWTNVPAGGVYRYELCYERSGDDNTTTDVSWLPELDRWRLTDRATAEAFLALHNWDAAAIYMQRWNDDIGKAIQSNAKRRWASGRYQALSWQQDYKLRWTQSASD